MANEFLITDAEYAVRHRKVKEAMAREGFDAIFAYSTAKCQANVRYLARYYVRWTGMQTREDGSYYLFGSTACLFPRDDGEPVVRTDQPWDIARCREVSLFSDAGHADTLAADLGPIIKKRGYKRVGIDNWFVFPAREYIRLQQECPGTEFVPTQLMSQVRRVKSPVEQAIMRRASEVADAAVVKALGAIKVGGSEFEISLICEYEMRSGGDLHCSGESIGGCGPNTSTGSFLPSRYNDRAMQAGEWVMLDVCPRVEGYSADISRHRLVGEEKGLDPKLRRMYDTCVLMSEEVRKAIKPGVTGRQLNKIALDIATAGGFGENKIGLLGHGIGIDIHDIPDYYYDDSPWQAGEIVTVEPCLLMRGVAGVRIEDMVLVTDKGSETLSNSSRALTE